MIPLSSDKILLKSLLYEVIAVLVLANLGLWLLVGYSIHRSYQQYTRVAQARVHNFALALDEAISGVIAKSDVALLVARDEILRQKASGGTKGEELHLFLLRQKNRLPELNSIIFANAEGITINNSDTKWDAASNITDRDYFVQLRDNPQDRLLIPRPVIGKLSKKKVLLLTRRVTLPDGFFGGVIIATLPVSYFEQLFKKQHLKTNLHIGLWGADLQSISHFEALADAPVSGEEIEAPRQWKDLLALDPAENGLFQAECPIDKVPFQYAYRRLEPYPLYISVGLAKTEYLAGWYKERLVTVLGATGISILSLVMAWLFYRNWQRSQQSLLETIQQEEKYHTVADYTLDWEFWQAPDGHLIYCSPSCLQLTGYPVESFYSGSLLFEQIIHPDDSSLWSGHQHTEDPHADPSHLLVRIVTAAGQTRWFEHVCRAVQDATGRFQGVRGSFRDVNERILAEKQLLLLNNELEQRIVERTAQLTAANKELEAFSYSVSHDLRAPLRHLIGFVELLNKKAPKSFDAQIQHYLEVISQSATRMSTLIDDLLSFSRMGRTELMQREINMDQLLGEVQLELQNEVGKRQISWTIGPLPVVTGDPAMLKQVLLNLLSNAIKYTARQPVAEIEIGCQSNGNEQEFFVRDNGVGFDMQYYDKLFGLFQRLHNSEEFEGNGVGLANVQRIIQRHGGRIWAESALGAGATFFFALPDMQKIRTQVSKEV